MRQNCRRLRKKEKRNDIARTTAVDESSKNKKVAYKDKEGGQKHFDLLKAVCNMIHNYT